jgi:hypothetical protein
VDGLLSGAGQFCWDGGPVYHGGEAPLVRLSAENGVCRAAVGGEHVEEMCTWDVRRWKTIQAFMHTYKTAKGQEVGALASGWLVYGGRRLFSEQAESGTWRNHLHLLCPDEEGRGRLPVLYAEDESARMPAWDEQDVLFPIVSRSPRFTGLMLSRQTDVRAAAEAQMPEATTEQILARRNQCANGQSIPPEQLRQLLPSLSGMPARWRVKFKYGWSPVACVLARDAALVAVRRRDGSLVAAYNRSGGEKRWDVELPASALHDGLAVAPDGSVVVSMTDGRTLCIGE